MRYTLYTSAQSSVHITSTSPAPFCLLGDCVRHFLRYLAVKDLNALCQVNSVCHSYVMPELQLLSRFLEAWNRCSELEGAYVNLDNLYFSTSVLSTPPLTLDDVYVGGYLRLLPSTTNIGVFPCNLLYAPSDQAIIFQYNPVQS